MGNTNRGFKIYCFNVNKILYFVTSRLTSVNQINIMEMPNLGAELDWMIYAWVCILALYL